MWSPAALALPPAELETADDDEYDEEVMPALVASAGRGSGEEQALSYAHLDGSGSSPVGETPTVSRVGARAPGVFAASGTRPERQQGPISEGESVAYC